MEMMNQTILTQAKDRKMDKNIVLTDITKLHGGMCCVAGVCLEDGRLYRLSAPGVSLDSVMRGGWRIGTVLSGTFCHNAAVGSAHVEDSRWSGHPTVEFCGDATLEAFYARTSVSSLTSALGIVSKGTFIGDFTPRGRSIATIRTESISIQVKPPYCAGGKESLRVHLMAAGMTLTYLAVTDQRFFNKDGSINREAVEVAQEHLCAVARGNEQVYVRVGITRPYDPKGMGNLQYWTQIDGLHFFNVVSGKYVRDFTRTNFVGSFFESAREVA